MLVGAGPQKACFAVFSALRSAITYEVCGVVCRLGVSRVQAGCRRNMH